MSASRGILAACVSLAIGFGSTSAWCEESSTLVASEGVDPLQATPTQSEQAQSRFARGKQLFTEGNFEEAAREFQASRAIVASPNARLYRARCLVQLGRPLEAYVEFGRTMVQALELAKQDVRYTHTAQAATQERSEVEAQLAFVRINVHHARADTRLFVNGEEIRRQAWSEPVPAVPGANSVELTTLGSAPVRRDLLLDAGSKVELVLDAETATPSPARAQPRAPAEPMRDTSPAPAASLRPYAYAAGALALVGYGGFVFFGLGSEQTYSELEERCAAGVCPATERATIDTGQRQQLLANIGLGLGVLATGAAVTLWVMEPSDEKAGSNLHLAFGTRGLWLRGRL